MASAMTYDSLVQDLQDYCERSDDPFLNQIPRFIMLAENRIASENKPLGFVRTVSGTLSSNILQKPIRWRKTKSLSLIVGAERRYLYARPYEFLRSYWPDTSQLAAPYYYADYDYEHYFVVPTPDMAYQFELQYWERPVPLDSTNQTNWTTQYAPQLLLYATMIEAMPFLKTSERIPEFQGLYDRALQAITKEDSERVVDNAGIRS